MQDLDWDEEREDVDGSRRGRSRPGPVMVVLASLPWLLVLGLLVLPGRTSGDPSVEEIAVADAAAADRAFDATSPQDESTADVAAPSHAVADPGLQPAEPPPTVDGAVPRPGDPAADDPAADDPTADDPTADDLGAVDGGALDGAFAVTELQGRWRSQPGEEEAVSLAVVAARAWLTGISPVLSIGTLSPAGPGGYAEHLVIEAVERPAAGALVVTLVAVVLDTGDEQNRVDVRRIAVPIAETPAGPRLGGAPWELAPPVLDQAALPRLEMTDPADLDAARQALLTAGLGTWEPVALHATDGWPVIAEVVATGEDHRTGDVAADGVTHEIWLRHHLGGFAVAGAPVTRPDVRETQP